MNNIFIILNKKLNKVIVTEMIFLIRILFLLVLTKGAIQTCTTLPECDECNVTTECTRC
jgi:hypothetical protein